MRAMIMIFLAIAACSDTRPGADTCDESDKAALIALYHSTNGARWKKNSGWLTDAPISTWHGVTVELERVVTLDLSQNNLQGAIPSELGRLVYLGQLYLDANRLTGEPGLHKQNPIENSPLLQAQFPQSWDS